MVIFEWPHARQLSKTEEYTRNSNNNANNDNTLLVEVWQITSREIVSKNTNLQLKRKSIVLDGYKLETMKCMNT